jgi:hypothetical protein
MVEESILEGEVVEAATLETIEEEIIKRVDAQ